MKRRFAVACLWSVGDPCLALFSLVNVVDASCCFCLLCLFVSFDRSSDHPLFLTNFLNSSPSLFTSSVFFPWHPPHPPSLPPHPTLLWQFKICLHPPVYFVYYSLFHTPPPPSTLPPSNPPTLLHFCNILCMYVNITALWGLSYSYPRSWFGTLLWPGLCGSQVLVLSVSIEMGSWRN